MNFRTQLQTIKQAMTIDKLAGDTTMSPRQPVKPTPVQIPKDPPANEVGAVKPTLPKPINVTTEKASGELGDYLRNYRPGAEGYMPVDTLLGAGIGGLGGAILGGKGRRGRGGLFGALLGGATGAGFNAWNNLPYQEAEIQAGQEAAANTPWNRRAEADALLESTPWNQTMKEIEDNKRNFERNSPGVASMQFPSALSLTPGMPLPSSVGLSAAVGGLPTSLALAPTQSGSPIHPGEDLSAKMSLPDQLMGQMAKLKQRIDNRELTDAEIQTFLKLPRHPNIPDGIQAKGDNPVRYHRLNILAHELDKLRAQQGVVDTNPTFKDNLAEGFQDTLEMYKGLGKNTLTTIGQNKIEAQRKNEEQTKALLDLFRDVTTTDPQERSQQFYGNGGNARPNAAPSAVGSGGGNNAQQAPASSVTSPEQAAAQKLLFYGGI